ncbi:MAG: aldo/keto reductase [Actinobacteria bacterium]|nr:aldo/keto reductase [Actinomycetota bacterium]
MLADISATVALANGVEMPRLGLGTYKSAEGGDVERAVETALSLGYRSIDTASLYGNETGIGRAIAASGVARDDLFLASKVWNDEQGYESTLTAFRRSLARLGTDYLDLYLIHWPRPQTRESWRALEHLYSEGTVRAIGVCNHLVHHLDALLEVADVTPMVNQYEFHPWLQQPTLRTYCQSAGIVVEAWAPLMRGRAGEVPEIRAIAEAHHATPAQVALRWLLQLGAVVIPKSVHPERISENADVFGFELTPTEMRAIDGLDRGVRFGPDPDRGGER